MRFRFRWSLLATAFLSAVLASSPRAQADAEEAIRHVQGGFVTWTWVWRDPNAPQRDPSFRVWTAEDGARIRYRDPATGDWSFQKTGPHRLPYRHVIALPDGETAIAVGDGGQWAWTQVAHVPGITWKAGAIEFPAGSGNHPRFWATAITSAAETIWVVGEGGILASSNSITGSGLQQKTFQPGEDPVALGIDMKGIAFVPGTLLGAACGDDTIYWTDDGELWTKATIHFRDPLTGASVPPPSAGGKTLEIWKLEFVPNPEGLNPPPLEGFAVGGTGNGEGMVFHTLDGGQTWEQEFHECELVPNPTELNCPSLAACPDPSLAKGGAPINADQTLLQYAVHPFPDGTALSVGYGGQILRRNPNVTIGGIHPWESVMDACVFPTQPLWGLHGDGDQTAWLGGMMNAIRRTEDRGTTWANEAWEQGWRFGAVDFVTGGAEEDGLVGWLAGQGMRISRTEDGGTTWVEQLDTDSHITSIAMFDDGNADPLDDVGAAVGRVKSSGDWAVFHTTDGGLGAGWLEGNVLSAAVKRDLEAVTHSGTDAAGNQHFWAVGRTNAVFWTDDDGVTWRTGHEPGMPTFSWFGVDFFNLDTGVVVGRSGASTGRAYLVENATDKPNRTWTPLPLPAGIGTLNDVDIAGIHGYIVGDGGTVLRWTGTQLVEVPEAAALTNENLLSVEVELLLGPSSPEHEVFIGGDNGVLLHFDGTAWNDVKSYVSNSIRSLSFLSYRKGYYVASGGPGPDPGKGQSTLMGYGD
ncbi:MAG: hypothetical protein AAF682_10145 [Planctomycetota bacterium]